MPVTRITSKGQATIPKSIRKVLNVRPHDRIAFHVRDGRVWLEGQQKAIKGLFGKYKYKVKRPLSIKQMNDALGKRFADDCR
jgi:antitoxin PrlF